nr:MAG TPA: hypothetical protein [Caudoviricetes sp.]
MRTKYIVRHVRHFSPKYPCMARFSSLMIRRRTPMPIRPNDPELFVLGYFLCGALVVLLCG